MRKLWTSLLIAVLAAASMALTPTTAGADIRIDDGDDCPDIIKPVADLYRAFFLRAPDAGGLAFWTQFVSSEEGSLVAAMDAFAASPEFFDRYGELTDREFIEQIYPNILGRAPDPGGLEFWIDNLAQGIRTRSEVVLYWSGATEFAGEGRLSPLVYASPDNEHWCGTGAATFRVPRFDLSVAQSITVTERFASADNLSDHYVYAVIIGKAENGTDVIRSESALNSETESAVTLYAHPSVAVNVAYYEVRVFGSGDWQVVSERIRPPWFSYS